jgi:isoleucyl-tRNA synthetase
MDQKGLRQTSEAAISSVQWIPTWGEARIKKMLTSRPDWCISRQRTWGVPLCLLVHKETDELHPKTIALMLKVAEKIEKKGIQAWYDLDLHDLLGDEAKDYCKVNDILDVWFDSGVTHQTVVERRESLKSPADLYLEGSDQHRGWFQSSLLTGMAMNKRAPYKAVLTHGFVVDASGQKMSKSLGNVIAPMSIINKLGADILRLWVASTDYQSEMTVSDDILKRTTDTYRRLRNTARFLLANLKGFDPEVDLITPEKMLSLDRWAVNCTLTTQKQLQSAYNEYNFILVTQTMHHFCAIDMGGFYLDIIKDRQYTAQSGSLAHQSCQTALYHILHAVIRWFVPIMPFTAQELWNHFLDLNAAMNPVSENKMLPNVSTSLCKGATLNTQKESLFWMTWYDGLFESDPKARITEKDWRLFAQIKDALNHELELLRKNKTIGSSLEAEVCLEIIQNLSLVKALALLDDELRFILITSQAHVEIKNPSLLSENKNLENAKNSNSSGIEGLRFRINVSNHKKCERCWHRSDTIGQHKKHLTLCTRCIENVDNDGENRYYA